MLKHLKGAGSTLQGMVLGGLLSVAIVGVMDDNSKTTIALSVVYSFIALLLLILQVLILLAARHESE